MRLETIIEANVAEKLKADPKLAKFLAIHWKTDGTLPPYVVAKLGPHPSEQKIIQAWSNILDQAMSTSDYGDLSGGKFDLWVTRQYANGHANWEDISGEAVDALGQWYALSIRSLLEPRDQDFNKFKSIHELHKAMRNYSSLLDRIKNQAEIEKHKREKSETVLIDNDRFYVMIPYNYGSCYTFNNAEGVQANFCTGGSNGLAWSRRYMPDGPIVMIADKTNLKDKDGKWQMHAATNQLVNAYQENRHSSRLNDMKFSSLFPGLMRGIGMQMRAHADEIKEKSLASTEFIGKAYDVDAAISDIAVKFPVSWATRSGDEDEEEAPAPQQNLLEGPRSAIAKAALAGVLAVTSPKVPSKAPAADDTIEQGRSFPSTVQVVVDKDGKRHKVFKENNQADKTEYLVRAIVQSLGAERKNYLIRVNARDPNQAIVLANKKAQALGTLISSKLADEE